MLITGPGTYSIDMSRISCDYYKLLEGDEKAAHAFLGEYMKQYPWAEVTCGWLIMNIQNRQGVNIEPTHSGILHRSPE